MKISRKTYADLYGPTVGDSVRLGDTNLWISPESDTAVPGDEHRDHARGSTHARAREIDARWWGRAQRRHDRALLLTQSAMAECGFGEVLVL